jgi:hypothetical protein
MLNYKCLVSLLFVVFLSLSGVYAQSPVLDWAIQNGGTGSDIGYSITSDASGNVYTTGRFQNTVDFDPGAGTNDLISAGGEDVFIQKLDANGDLIWVKQMGGTGNETGYSIATDAAGNVYTCGWFEGVADFDPGAGTASLTSNGSSDIYIQKLDANGDLLWAKQIGGTGYDYGHSIIVDGNGNVYVTGSFRNTVDFDPGMGVANLTTASIYSNAYLLKLDVNGDFVWVKQFGEASSTVGYDLELDNNGDLLMIGSFQGSADFDPGLGTNVLASLGMSDVYILKMDVDANLIWVKQFGGTDIDQGMEITTDATGNVYSTGTFRGTVDFDPNAGVAELTSSGGNEIYIQKLNANGDFVWAKHMGGPDHDFSSSIQVDADQNVYNLGYFNGTADFDPGAGVNNLYSSGYTDIYLQKLDSNGDPLWIHKFGDGDSDQGISLAIGSNNEIFSTGFFDGTIDFDPGVTTSELTTVGGNDCFIQKLVQCSPSSGTDVITACDAYTWIDGNTYNSSNNTATWTLSNVAGCDSIVTLDLTINSVSDITTTTTDITISANNVAATYQWLDCNDNYAIISGENGQDFTPSLNGDYAVELTENGCVDTSECVAITTIGLDEHTNRKAWKVFPNPTNGSVKIDLGVEHEAVLVSVMDITGKVILKNRFEALQTCTFSIEGPSGVYFVEIVSGDARAVLKLIKK